MNKEIFVVNNMISKLGRKLISIKNEIQKHRYKQFYEIKKITNGYLSPEVYKSIYECALRAGSGYMVDIGPAQGGSSICLGLGILKSGKSSKVYSIEKCIGSNALVDKDDQKLNATALIKNLSVYNLECTNTLLVGDVKDVFEQVPVDKPLSLLFIDADGALDRDFRLFYNRLLNHSPIIIDDYKNKINRWARDRYLKWTCQEEMDQYVQSKDATSFLELCPLGKEYTTYQLVNFFLSKGLLTKDKIVGSTFFGRKVPGAKYLPEVYDKEIRMIREKILAEYYERRDTPLINTYQPSE